MGQSPWGAWHLQVPSAGMGALLLFAAVRNKTLGFDVWFRCIGWVYKQHILSFGTCWGAKRKRKHWWNYSVRWVECLGRCLRTADKNSTSPDFEWSNIQKALLTQQGIISVFFNAWKYTLGVSQILATKASEFTTSSLLQPQSWQISGQLSLLSRMPHFPH